jgi:hypothetical protein
VLEEESASAGLLLERPGSGERILEGSGPEDASCLMFPLV